MSGEPPEEAAQEANFEDLQIDIFDGYPPLSSVLEEAAAQDRRSATSRARAAGRRRGGRNRVEPRESAMG